MHVLVLSHIYPRPQDSGRGIGVHRQFKQLQQAGVQITVLSAVPWSPRPLHFNTKWHNYGQTPTDVEWEGIKVYYPRYLRLPGAWFRVLAGIAVYKAILPLASKLHNEQPIDVIHSNFILPDGLAGIRLGQKLKLPTVCTVRGSDAFIYPNENRLNLYYSKVVIRRTNQIVTVSQALKTAAETLAEPSQTVRVIYNGVEFEKFQPPGKDEANQSIPNILSKKPYILFVGRNIYIKGLKDLLEAFAKLVDKIKHNLVVVGAARSEVESLAPDLTALLKDRLIVTGPLPPDEIPAYMQNCDLFVLPSYSEGLGNVILEAMACERPVVATNICGIPELVIDGENGRLVPPGEPLILAEVIESLIVNPELCRQMGRRGRERVEKEFTWQGGASELISIYKYLKEEH